ncbi:MAG: hypothetical protein ACK6AT_03785, partial [Planctomycetota bacterium]
TKATSEGIGLGGNAGGNAGGNIPANHKESDDSQNAKTPPNQRPEDCKFVGVSTSMPPQGLEPWTR